MLEHRCLLLPPWETADGKQRPVLDAQTLQPLGLARWRPAGPAWLRWLTRPVLHVYETEDESLVFTVNPSWGRSGRWSVADADEHYLGVMRHFRGGWMQRRCLRAVGRRGGAGRMLIEDKFGRLSAVLTPPVVGEPGRFLGARGEELATFSTGPAGVCLTFADFVTGDPFARMLLLAAVLVWGT